MKKAASTKVPRGRENEGERERTSSVFVEMKMHINRDGVVSNRNKRSGREKKKMKNSI